MLCVSGDIAAELALLSKCAQGIEGLRVDLIQVQIIIVEREDANGVLRVEHEEQVVHGEGEQDAVARGHLLDREGVGGVGRLVSETQVTAAQVPVIIEVAAGEVVGEVVAICDLLHEDGLLCFVRGLILVTGVGHKEAGLLAGHGNETLVMSDDGQVDELRHVCCFFNGVS